MNALRNFLYAVLALLTTALSALSAEPATVLTYLEAQEAGFNLPAPIVHELTLNAEAIDPRAPDAPKSPKPPAVAAPVAPVKLTAPPTSTGFYADAGLALRTPDFKNGTYGYFAGVGYQVTRHWAADIRLTHEGLDADGSAIQDIGGRLVARMPFALVAPYTFLGATFDLERDEWRLQPGGGVELGLSKKHEGLRVFAEGGLDADLKGRNDYMFAAGVRLRF